MGAENNVGLEGCRIIELLLPYLSMVTVPHSMIVLHRDNVGFHSSRFREVSLNMICNTFHMMFIL